MVPVTSREKPRVGSHPPPGRCAGSDTRRERRTRTPRFLPGCDLHRWLSIRVYPMHRTCFENVHAITTIASYSVRTRDVRGAVAREARYGGQGENTLAARPTEPHANNSISSPWMHRRSSEKAASSVALSELLRSTTQHAGVFTLGSHGATSSTAASATKISLVSRSDDPSSSALAKIHDRFSHGMWL